MRIGDIVVAALPRGGRIVDPTEPTAELSDQLELPEPFGVRYVRAEPGDPIPPAPEGPTLVARTLDAEAVRPRDREDPRNDLASADVEALLFVDSLDAMLAALGRERDRAAGEASLARNEVARLLADNDRLSGELTRLRAYAQTVFRRFERSRSALSFRVGRATRVALGGAPSPARIVAGWREAFEGPDEMVEELRRP